MNLDQMIEELQIESRRIDAAIVALERLKERKLDPPRAARAETSKWIADWLSDADPGDQDSQK